VKAKFMVVLATVMVCGCAPKSDLVIDPRPIQDLQLTLSISVDPVEASVGEEVTLTWTLSNEGEKIVQMCLTPIVATFVATDLSNKGPLTFSDRGCIEEIMVQPGLGESWDQVVIVPEISVGDASIQAWVGSPVWLGKLIANPISFEIRRP